MRGSYLCLNGLWDYAVEDGDDHTRRNTGKILVPFAPESLLSGCGSVFKVEESRMNAVSAISGCGPAYMFTALDALSDAGVAMGLPRKTALELAAGTMLGSALMLEQTGEHPMALRDAVTSPGGTTIAALNALDECGFRNAWIQAVKSAVRRAEEMEGN